MMSNQETRKPLSQKALENLQRNETLRSAGSKFIKLDPGEKKTLVFDPEKIKTVEVEFEGKKQTKIEYTVLDPNISGVENQEKFITLSKRASASVDICLKDGHNQLTLHRVGSGKDTNYMVFAA